MSGQQTRGVEAWLDERDAAASALGANRERRARAETEVQAAREELRDLLVRGQAVAMDVAAMARTASVSRDTAHRLLRDAGSLSRRQKDRLATEIKQAR